MKSRPSSKQTIELLAPAGDWDCARAATENGADAIYFGLDCGFNARHRAKNFSVHDLPELTKWLRRRGVRGYATLNTLAFPSELKNLVRVIERIAESGIDAVLVQDFGVATLVRQICSELEIHASTQMSLTSAETIDVAANLGLSRVVLARELSIREIRKIADATEMPLEVFIHGALCVAYSGQCLTSESLGGRSANRGQCAQACRLPYELICDGKDRDLGDVRYLLSPQDLAGYAAIPDLIDAGIASVKIEGRLKTAEYVANITGHYRRSIEQAATQGRVTVSDQDKREMELSFSRGFTPGWLEGNDHKRLVPGLQSAKRGIPLGTIIETDALRFKIRLGAPVALGDGIAIIGFGGNESQGSRIYSLDDSSGQACKELAAGQTGWIGLGRGEVDWSRVRRGAAVFKNDDPRLNRWLRQSFSSPDPQCRRPLDLSVEAEVGSPLRLTGRLDRFEITVAGPQPLETATKHPATQQVLREKLSRLGGTPFRLGHFEVVITGRPMVPMGMLNQLRRELVDRLFKQLDEPPQRHVDVAPAARLLRPIAPSQEEHPGESGKPKLAVLCRTLSQVEAVAGTGSDVSLIYADFHDIRQYRDAVELSRQQGVPVGLATVRMQKPGERGLLKAIGKHQPDCILARNLAAIDFFRQSDCRVIADFSLNVANHRSAQWVRELGTERVTACYDLNREQLIDLVRSVRPDWMEVVIHQHMPMFHMEHCVFCSVLSEGTDKSNCGRPCDRHSVKLRDRVGAEHPLQADVACRNTLYNSIPQSGAETVDELKALRVPWYRIELLDHHGDQAVEVVQVYRRLLDGKITGQQVWRTLQATNRVGVTRGTLESKRDPLAIL